MTEVQQRREDEGSAGRQESTPSIPITGEDETSEVVKEAKRLEILGVRAAEGGDINTAMEYFSQAIDVAPDRASGYNNRAQALRLKGDVQGALTDLNKAIELSQAKGKAACQAFTQRGLIRRLEGQNELALEDFKKAADLGSAFAKSQVVQMNPYAAMCNKMLAEVMTKLKNGESVE
ncbi:tetratricopeptide repeat protein 36 homolog isoform X2 [Ptychodera flava]|uniref:tetratricopeptide repeat protein 36 homolog isoform X2 n=1 Tax=Ptychodera flava TaxID=63121 RepID=UPI00396A6DA6